MAGQDSAAVFSTKGARQGTGLGLSIAKTLVEKMGGRIWVDQQAIPGARFVFTVFPERSTKESVQNRLLPTNGPDLLTVLTGRRILLAEDNPENVVLIQAFLPPSFVSLDVASNGLEAVEKCQRSDYDLVLMDIQMPLLDGYAASRQVRCWEECNGKARVPIVALTAHAFSGAEEESRQAGCDGHLTKPIERRTLLEAVAQFARIL